MKGIEWIKITTNMCEDEKIRLFDSMEGIRDVGIYVWLRLLLQAGKVNDNGLIYLKIDVPYTKQMIAVLFERPVDIIERVLEILVTFQMIEIYEDGTIKISNWEKHQNVEGMKKVREGTRERVKNCRERKKEKELLNQEALEEDENKHLINRVKAEELSEEETNKKALDNLHQDKENINEKSKSKNCNANVTLKREKREEDKENKKKNIDKKEREDLEIEALKVMQDLEKINKNIKGLTLSWVKDMLTIHKEKYVKMAIWKALERNKLDTNYINGILNNWVREGYPKTYEEMEFSDSETGRLSVVKEKPNLRFINFEGRHYDYDELENKLLGWA